MKKIISFLTFTLLFISISFGQLDTNYKKSLKKMFEITGTEEVYKTAIKQMFTMFRNQNSDISADIWDALEKEFLKTSIDTLVDMLVPVYTKYMTQPDLEEIIKFYQTPVGQKYAKNTPLITQEAMQIGEKWGMKIGQEIDKKLKEKKQ